MKKKCLKCRKRLPIFAFSKHHAHRDGLQAQCKKCCARYAAHWRGMNQERKRAMDRDYAAKNAERARLKTRAWVKANPERKREADRKFRKDRPEQIYLYGVFCRLLNADQIRISKREWKEKNAARVIENRKRLYAENAEANRASSRAWAVANPDKRRVANAKRNAVKLRAVPSWSDPEAIEEWYALARHLTELSSIEHQVDHVIPLRSRLVCGLHWEGNMQLLTAVSNMSKGNKFTAD